MTKLFLVNPTTSAITLMTILLDKYSSEFLEWDPITINEQINNDFNIKLSDINSNKIQAVITLLTTDSYHYSLEAFNNINIALSGEPLNTSAFFLPADMEDILVGTLEAQMIEGDYNLNYSDNIKRFVGYMLQLHSINKKPMTLEWATVPLEETTLEASLSEDPVFLQTFWKKQKEEKKSLEVALVTHGKKIYRELSQLPNNMIDKSFLHKLI